MKVLIHAPGTKSWPRWVCGSILGIMTVLFLSLAVSADTRAEIKEYTLPSPFSYPVSIEVDSTGRIWFVEQKTSKIGLFYPETEEFKEFDLPEGSSPTDLAIDSQGNIWFTLSASTTNAIGRLLPEDGKLDIYKVPTEDAEPYKIAIAPDGGVWFTERNADKIGYFRDGQFREFSLPTPNSQPSGIGIDARGTVWFVESMGNRLGRIDPETGEVKEYEIPFPMANPEDLAIDGSGRVWFVEMSGNRLGMFDPSSGLFNEALIPTTGAVPVGIAISGDGIIWFTENRANKVGSFDPVNARMREYPVPTSRSLPVGISVDNKGRVWFTEADRDANAIAVLEVEDVAEEPPQMETDTEMETEEIDEAPRRGAMTITAIIILVILAAGLWYIIGRKGKGR